MARFSGKRPRRTGTDSLITVFWEVTIEVFNELHAEQRLDLQTFKT